MLSEEDLAGLNPAQAEAVNSMDGPLLVLAGAGSGKTRILTFRIAQLIGTGRAFPGEIMALTFTNKAAKEMKHRVTELIGGSGINPNDIWVSTFHSTGARLMRMYGDRVGLEPGFSIFDDSDSKTLIKHCLAELGISDKVVAPKAVHYKIQAMKNEGVDPLTFKAGSADYMDKKLEPVIHAYERGLRRNNAVDFSDLLLKVLELFRSDAEILERFQDQYRYFLVDEYQDTNGVQYHLLQLLAAKYRNLCVVGDEDQSIYKWRGADISNILNFEKDYPEAKVVKLEENYRSTSSIIKASNSVISNNTQRKEKTLFTNNPKGDPVEVHTLESDFEESKWVVRKISQQINNGASPDDIAIFYRTHAQSRLFEDMLRAQRVHYQIFGGLKFYDRAEIKDAIAYLKLLANERDNIALTRIINVPARGIGKTTVDKIRTAGVENGVSMFEAAREMSAGNFGVTPAVKKKLKPFMDLVASLNKDKPDMDLRDLYSVVLENSGYIATLKKQEDIESATKLENLQELASAIADYESRTEESSLEGFLEEIALYTDQDRSSENESAVTMMTIHSAKGLEYPNVFLVGLEEELFPSIRGDSFAADPDEIEEERRLCYVGMTRARKKLFLTSAHVRRVFGLRKIRRLSRFVSELPQEEIILEDHSPSMQPKMGLYNSDYQDTTYNGFDSHGAGGSHSSSDQTYSAPRADDFAEFFESPEEKDGFDVGIKVKHPDYGEGVVVARQGARDTLKLSIKFARVGTKKFLAKYAPLEKVMM